MAPLNQTRFQGRARRLVCYWSVGRNNDTLRTLHFNPLLLREQLYRVTADGANFSPWVFNLLDARIRRLERT